MLVRKKGYDKLPVHGVGKSLVSSHAQAERLVRRMVIEGLLTEETHRPEADRAVVATLAVRAAPRACLLRWSGCATPPPSPSAPLTCR